MTLADSIQGLRLRALELAKQLGSVTEACDQLGISRSLFYRWRRRFESYGPDGLHPKRTGAHAGRPSTVTPEQERAVIALALAGPSFGPQRLADQLSNQSVRLAPSTIHRLLATGGAGHSSGAPGRHRTSQRANRRTAHRTHARKAVARSFWPHPACAG